uniref:BRCT domain-containing protein n=1 Tax=Cyprinodon variegatus TaxID=28743 RepID=A0A3Q2G0J4_CYPVA
MSEEEIQVPEELFKDVKFYVVGDIEPKVVQLLKAGKGKEVSYNALATHIIAEDGDSPEVSESREVFDLPVVKVTRLVTGFSPESGQIFFGVTACLPRVRFCRFNVLCSFVPHVMKASIIILCSVCVCVCVGTQLPEDLDALWALLTFHGGECQLNLNKRVTHLVVKEPKGVSSTI